MAVLKRKLKDPECKGSHQVLQATKRRKSFDNLEERAKFDRLNFWMDNLKELNDDTDLSDRARAALSKQLLTGLKEADKPLLTNEQTAEFFLSLRADKIGIITSDVKTLLKIRLQRLLTSGQLVYEELSSPAEIKVRVCIVGDKETTKVCFQPQVKAKNNSYLTLSLLGL
uniref:Uncharacterized protein n=1 Tax=Rhabditophanes sp. KR3021 TaxID=114890 RepID=A0AC35TXR6_9BILA